MTSARVAVLVDDLLQQHILKDTLARLGFDLVINTEPSKITNEQLNSSDIDVWLVNLGEDGEAFDGLERLLHGDIPVLVGIDPAPQRNSPSFLRWEKRLLSKLRDLTYTPAPSAAVADISLVKASGQEIFLPLALRDLDQVEPIQIWVLGASLGGPEAVKQFLDALPAGLPVAFIYAQHIDERFESALIQAVGRHSVFNLRNFEDGLKLSSGDVLVAPVKDAFMLSADGRFTTTGRAWSGPYGPSIDEVIDRVYHETAERFGCILFSGMGSDGAESITGLPAGLPLWAQKPDTCGNSSMPESAIGTGKITYIGDPHQLAFQLVQNVKQYWIEHYESDSRHQHG